MVFLLDTLVITMVYISMETIYDEGFSTGYGDWLGQRRFPITSWTQEFVNGYSAGWHRAAEDAQRKILL